MTGAAEGVIVVTGAASGMGLACAQRLARSGSTMVLGLPPRARSVLSVAAG